MSRASPSKPPAKKKGPRKCHYKFDFFQLLLLKDKGQTMNILKNESKKVLEKLIRKLGVYQYKNKSSNFKNTKDLFDKTFCCCCFYSNSKLAIRFMCSRHRHFFIFTLAIMMLMTSNRNEIKKKKDEHKEKRATTTVSSF
jgi:hypothetical protein